MTDQQPPAGTPEYLDSTSGDRAAPETGPGTGEGEEPAGRRSRRATWLVGGGVIGVVALGAGAWAAMSFLQQGEQPAAALPSTTVAYASIDLDPSGSQKIDAFRTLNKFPAFKDKVGIHSVDDVRQKLGDELIKSLGCDGLTFDHDIDPWLGNRAAVAAVDLGGTNPEPVSVVQVTDDGKADAGLEKLMACGGDTTGDVAYDVHDGWAILASSQDAVHQVVSGTDHASLADDDTYQKWTKATGDSGVVTLYAAPAAGDYLSRQLSDLESNLGGLGLAMDPTRLGTASYATSSAYHSTLTTDTSGLDRVLEDFQGAAATIRFTGDGLELSTVSDPSLSQSSLASDQGGAIVQNLPDDTAAAIGIGLEPGWLSSFADRIALYSGDADGHQLLQKLSRESGLDLPDDVETLLGSSTALSISKDFDYEAASMSDDGSGVPVAVTVKGDPAAIDQVLRKIRAQEPGAAVLGTDSSGDLVAMGPTPAYRQEVLAGGHLGDTEAFRGVIPDAADAGIVVYVDVDGLDKVISQLAGGDQQVDDNLAPLKALGFSSWMDGDVARMSLKVSTD
jgi:hypothetical protein